MCATMKRSARHIVACGVMLAGILLASCPRVCALNPALDVRQYGHTSWNVRDGFTKGEINAIAQTPDGYLWLGTQFGLLRFDGVKTVTFQPPADQQLPSNYIYSLLTARDGTLWIGTAKGLASWKDAKLTSYAELADKYVFRLVEDHEGTVWVGAVGVPTGRLCSIKNGGVKCSGDDGSLGRAVVGLFEDRKGNLWVGVENGLWRWQRGQATFYPLPGESDGIRALGEDVDGTLLVGWNGGIQRLLDGKTEAHSDLHNVGQFRAKELLRDRDGGLWILTHDRGIVHLYQGRADVFGPAEGLSGEAVNDIFEDREGCIWIATVNGLDRFREFAVVSFKDEQGLSGSVVGSVLASRDGSVWLATFGGLNRWTNSQLKIYPKDLGATQPRTGGNKSDQKVHGFVPHSLFQDHLARLWVSTFRGVGYLENDRFVLLSGVPGGNVLSIAEDKPDSLWILNENIGLIHMLHGSKVDQISWDKLGHKDHASTLISDPSRGGLWLGFFLGGIVHMSEGQVRASFTSADGLGEGHINYMRVDQQGALWIATDGGLSLLKNGRIATLTSKNGLPCDLVHWAIQDDSDSFWLYTGCGLVRIARAELNTWAAAMAEDGDAKPTIHVTVFDSSDGVRIVQAATHYSPKVSKSADGRLWFAGVDGVMVVDPQHLAFNKLPPPVHVEQITADRKTYDAAQGLRLPPLVRDLEIDFTALSLVAPEKVRFRYKLEGYDHDWQEAGSRRQAFYTNLPPRNYRFRVMAANNSGVWNEAGAVLDFSIAPAYYQTTWFRLALVVLFLALVWAAYRFRVRQLATQFNRTLDARVNERTRIARELHDTLLQSFQGLLLRFQSVANVLPSDAQEARQRLDRALDQAAAAITEGRDAVQGLRTSASETNDLANGIAAIAEELTSDVSAGNAPAIDVEIEGTTRNLNPVVRDEACRIAGEAMRNAFRHAQAGQIRVEIRYDKRQFRLQIRDDGKGIDEATVQRGHAGHFGLRGMRERAEIVGGKLEVWSKPDFGTQIELSIPSAIAYDGSNRQSVATASSGRPA